MLKQRVITSIVLLTVLLPALFSSSSWPFVLLTLMMIGAATWEWGRLNRASFLQSVMMACAVMSLCALAYSQSWEKSVPRLFWWYVCTVWIVCSSWMCWVGHTTWSSLSGVLRCIFGCVMLCAAWFAMVHARAMGTYFLLSVFFLVWVADIAAYIGGKSFGKRKLAPTISPGKSWEGAFSGVLGVMIFSGIWIFIDTYFSFNSVGFFTLFYQRFGYFFLILALIFLSAASVLGDLTESLVKRAAGVKDSSQLLPGHGGVLDRIDGLLPVFPMTMALISL
jgi:phosphatidate cytidylyltransferase